MNTLTVLVFVGCTLGIKDDSGTWWEEWFDKSTDRDWADLDSNFDIYLKTFFGDDEQYEKEMVERWHDVCNPDFQFCADNRSVNISLF